PGPDNNRLYIVYVAPNVVVTQGNSSSVSGGKQGFSGYHSMNVDFLKGNLTYAVIVDPTGYSGFTPLGAVGGLSPLQYDTFVSSHELAEACTDADALFGWIDRDLGTPTTGDEIADIAGDIFPAQFVTGYIGDGYAVEKEWLNSQNGIYLYGANFQVIGGTLY